MLGSPQVLKQLELGTQYVHGTFRRGQAASEGMSIGSQKTWLLALLLPGLSEFEPPLFLLYL